MIQKDRVASTIFKGRNIVSWSIRCCELHNQQQRDWLKLSSSGHSRGAENTNIIVSKTGAESLVFSDNILHTSTWNVPLALRVSHTRVHYIKHGTRMEMTTIRHVVQFYTIYCYYVNTQFEEDATSCIMCHHQSVEFSTNVFEHTPSRVYIWTNIYTCTHPPLPDTVIYVQYNVHIHKPATSVSYRAQRQRAENRAVDSSENTFIAFYIRLT